jgi:GNAT superfamily N-acetyltransferase
MALDLRQLEVFKPYDQELPHALLEDEALSDEAIERWLGADILRVGKLGAEVLGVYAMERVDVTGFLLHGVIVARSNRKQGLGRWLVGHAIGVAEFKGGRHLHTNGNRSSRLYTQIGFTLRDGEHIFDMIQE